MKTVNQIPAPKPQQEGNEEEPSSTETCENSDFPDIEIPEFGNIIEELEDDSTKKS
ncbi:MAG: hypothetical protein QM669_08940 [Siphonobacter sp.]